MAKPRSAAQKAALRKAQAVSAAKRRKGSSTRTYKGDSRGRKRKDGKYHYSVTSYPAPKKKGGIRAHVKRNKKKYIAGAVVAGAVAYHRSLAVQGATHRVAKSPAAAARGVKKVAKYHKTNGWTARQQARARITKRQGDTNRVSVMKARRRSGLHHTGVKRGLAKRGKKKR